MDIWGILGIDKTAGLEEIRAAYAEKVKKFHPEDDPEGFMRIREAYKKAVRMASSPTSDFMPPAPQYPEQKSFAPIESSEQVIAVLERVEDTPPKADFDFLEIERISAQKAEEERRAFERFFAGATALYKSRRRKNVQSWQKMFSQIDVDKMKRNETFTWGFLDFIAMTPAISEQVRKEVLDPFAAKLRMFWQGTPLWAEFDFAVQKYVSAKLKKADRVLILQFLSISLPFALYYFLMWLTKIYFPIHGGTPEELLSGLYTVSVATLICIICALAAFPVIQAGWLIAVSKTVNKGVSGILRKNKSFLMLMFSACIALSMALIWISEPLISDISGYAADLKQLDDGRLNEGLFYLYSKEDIDDTKSKLSVKSIEIGAYGFILPSGIEFNPDEAHLYNPGVPKKIDEEDQTKIYRITYTDYAKVVSSIVEAP